jgi:hypothetical protein
MSTLELLLATSVFVVASGLVVIGLAVRALRRRYERFRQETGMILANHQNYLATQASALNRLGARVEPVATAEEMQEGRWMR